MNQSFLSQFGAKIFAGFVLMAVAGSWFRNTFPEPEDRKLVYELRNEPVQTKTSQPLFEVSQGGLDYKVEPLYEYELWGWVVSKRIHDSKRRRASDSLNVADLCVVWGTNATQLDLNEFHFRNQEFTCFFETRSPSAAAKFKVEAISNNHLITENPALREQVEAVKVGDQIRLKGWLAKYSNEYGSRSSSVTRTDTGNGACETIYINEFEIKARMSNLWRNLKFIGIAGCILSMLVFFITLWMQERKLEAEAY